MSATEKEQMVRLVCPTCTLCMLTSVLMVTRSEYDRFMRGELIQDVWPEMDPAERETIKSGIHPVCWNAMLGLAPVPRPDEIVRYA